MVKSLALFVCAFFAAMMTTFNGEQICVSTDIGHKHLTDFLHGKGRTQNRQVKIGSNSDYDKNSRNPYNKNNTNINIDKGSNSESESGEIKGSATKSVVDADNAHRRIKRQYGYYGAGNRYAGGRSGGGRFGRPGRDWGGGGRSMLSNPCAYGAGQQGGCMRKKRSVSGETDNKDNNKNAEIVLAKDTKGDMLNIPDKNICPANATEHWTFDFKDCFSKNKFTTESGSKDVSTIVDRIFQYSRGCIQNYSKSCRPDYQGFIIIMSKIISHMQKYTSLYLNSAKYKPEEINNLKCLSSLSTGIYKNCFRTALSEKSSDTEFQKNVEKSIICTDKYHESCSNSAQSTIHEIVRLILGVKQTLKDNLKDEIKQESPENKQNVDNYKTMFFLTLWDMIKSHSRF